LRGRAARLLGLALCLCCVACLAVGQADAASPTVIDWSKGYNQSTEASCGEFTFTHMQDRKSYMLYIRGKESGTCTFKADGLTFLSPPNFGQTTQGTRSIFAFVRYGSEVLVACSFGY
jgi:hypothetical protein